MALLEWEKWQNGSSFRWRNIAISLIDRPPWFRVKACISVLNR
jgi:hypothetical protein